MSRSTPTQLTPADFNHPKYGLISQSQEECQQNLSTNEAPLGQKGVLPLLSV